MSVVRLRNAVCLLGRFPALAGADLDVRAGEIVWLSGPNGAGKTTLLKLLAGLLQLHRGTATVLGIDLAIDRHTHRSSLAFAGHDTFAYDDLSVSENLGFAARAVGASQDAAANAATHFGLDDLAAVTHANLSAGQRKRLALAMAFARDADLILLDEPHAGLDLSGRELLDAELVRAATAGRTVIYSSHETDRAVGLNARTVRIVGGLAFQDALAEQSE